jgi:hypothetical protein
VRPVDQGKTLRRPAADVPSITGLRLSPHGAEASLVNISATGLFAESSVRLNVGTSVQVLFEGAFSPSSVPGRVARCEVAAMGRDGALRYQIGIEFNSPIAFDDVVVASPKAHLSPGRAPAPHPSPVPRVAQNRW